MKYLVSVRIDDNTEMFGFDTEEARDSFILEIEKDYPEVQYITTEDDRA